MAINKTQKSIKAILSSILLLSFLCIAAKAEESEIVKVNIVPSAANAKLTQTSVDIGSAPRVVELKADSFSSFESSPKSSSFGDSLFTASLITSAALNAADYFTTMKALKHERLVEGNPLMKPFVKKPAVFAAVKIGVSVTNYYLLKKLYKKNKTLAWVLSTASNFVLSYVVANSLSKIQKAQGM